ncbi:hypothetical protein [Microbulbifer magnicolonia]|uniref:hypothetical protein n=1 Tax=Microbulbifer magnicolonia TaxID=3109744 RepID=UPI002B4168F4|nr:hypothetical protein [Microbulbifer sp. GG15]
MPHRTLIFAGFAAAILLAGCGVADTRDEVVYPYSKPIPRTAEYRATAAPPAPAAPAAQKTNYSTCPGDAEELAEGSICPPTAQCFEISGGRRCIVYPK